MRRVRRVTVGILVGFAVALIVTVVYYASQAESAVTGARARACQPPDTLVPRCHEQAAKTWDGVYAGNSGQPGIAAFERFLGQPVHYVTVFLDDRDWKFIDRPTHFGLPAYENQSYRLVISVPLLPTDSKDTLEEGAAGDLNVHFLNLANGLVSMGMGHSIIRLGWELAGNWFPWSAQSHPAVYAQYWRQVVTTMRSVPGAGFGFDWNGGSDGENRWNPVPAYPGDSYVDYVTADVYDWAPDRYTSNSPSSATTELWWNSTVLNGPYGLNWTASFAAAHDKPVGLPEWGLMIRPDGQGGGDDTTFLRDMYAFITSHDVAYANYFNYDVSSTGARSDLTDGGFPNSARLYRELFGAGGTG